MRFNVSKLLVDRSGSSREFEVRESLRINGASVFQLFEGTVSLRRTDKGIWATTKLITQSTFPCSRCLKEYTQVVSLDFDEEFFTIVTSDDGKQLQRPTYRQESRMINNDNTLDLSDVVRQYYSLGLPMKPLCQMGCQGICPICGSDRNELDCKCSGKFGDLRMKELLENVYSDSLILEGKN